MGVHSRRKYFEVTTARPNSPLTIKCIIHINNLEIEQRMKKNAEEEEEANKNNINKNEFQIARARSPNSVYPIRKGKSNSK